MSQGKFSAALERYRNTLCAVEAHNISAIRLKFMCQMAELLIQGLTGEDYQPPINSTVKNSIWKPKQYASLNQVGSSVVQGPSRCNSGKEHLTVCMFLLNIIILFCCNLW